MAARERRRYELIGIPFDGAATLGWPGSRYAPARIREQLAWMTMRAEDGEVYSLDTGELHPAPNIEDAGDVSVVPHDVKTTLDRSAVQIAESVRAGTVPLVLGGDDSVLYALVDGVHRATLGRLGVIHFDAHLDIMDHNERQGSWSHSSGMRRGLELERVDREHAIQIGLRHFNYPSSRKAVNELGPAQITAGEFHRIGVELSVERILDHVRGADHIVLSFDIDAIDPAHAPGAGAHEPGGLTSRQAIDAVRALAPHIDAFAVTEVNPLTDHRDLTSNLAAYLTYYTAVFG
ncbi:arginase family protein [Saccharopolyspora sp. NPDC050389]|uniref:arginase family protein n=1 Tax=Saccharopolyspora sp. NPDC050389 TaxID=3155516 RepID=UPI0033FA620D